MKIQSLAIATLLAVAAPAAAQPQGKGSPGHGPVVMWRSAGMAKGRLGVQVHEITEELRQFYGSSPDSGILVGRVDKDSPAQKAGVLVGDLIVSVAGRPVASAMDVWNALAGKRKGETADVVVVRGKQRITLKATLEDDGGGLGAFGSFDVKVPGWDGDFKGMVIPWGHDDALREKLERMEKRMKELERKLEQMKSGT